MNDSNDKKNVHFFENPLSKYTGMPLSKNFGKISKKKKKNRKMKTKVFIDPIEKFKLIINSTMSRLY